MSAPMQVGPQGRFLLNATSLSHTEIPILLLQDRLCPKPPPWGRNNSRSLLRSGGKLLFSGWSAGRGEHLDCPSLIPLSSRYSGSGFALSHQLNSKPPQIADTVFDQSCECLMWEIPCQWTELSTQLHSCPPPILSATASPNLSSTASAARGEMQLCTEGTAWGPPATKFLPNPHVQGWHSVRQVFVLAFCTKLTRFFLSHPT